MVSFEQEIKAFLSSRKLVYKDGSSSFKRLDFSVKLDENWTFHFDAKEKRQKINLFNWKITAEQEPHTFIIDDLAARKILAFGPYAGMVVRDNLLGEYYFYSILDLFLMPKTRVNRPIEKNTKAMKGKWIIDLRSGTKCSNMDEVLQLIKNYITKREDLFLNILDCYGNYHGENIGERGEVRRAKHWDTDVKETR
jgi:hypothetical protein